MKEDGLSTLEQVSKKERAREKKGRKKERNEGGIQQLGKGRGMEEEDTYTDSHGQPRKVITAEKSE